MCLGVKHNSYFLRWGMETDMSLISSRMFSSATSSIVFVAVVVGVFPFCEGSISTRRRLRDDPDGWSPICSYTKSAMLLNN